MLINNTRTRFTAPRSVIGGAVAFPMVAVSLGAFAGHRGHTGS